MDSFGVTLNHTPVNIEGSWTPQWEKVYSFSIDRPGSYKIWLLLFKDSAPSLPETSAEAEERIMRIIEEVRNEGGVPNFYGLQRFGLVRPVTHIVGLKLLKGDFKGAAMDFLSQVYPLEREDAKEARHYLKETMDFKGALKMFPEHLVYERAMLNHLVKYPNDFVGAFRKLPRGLTLMFIHATQSYIFNLTLSKRRSLELPLRSVIVGDFAVTLSNGLPNATIVVDEGNINEVNSLIKAGKAALALPVVGYDMRLPSGSLRDIVAEILSELNLNLDAFKIKSMPELSARGSIRQALVNPPMLKLVRISRDPLLDGVMASLAFALPKGSYATCLLREIMKTEPIKY